jgi:WD40 repeat protein
MLAVCGVLVGVSYLMLYILSGLIVAPKTPVQEIAGRGELVLSIEDDSVPSMQVSAGGRYIAFTTLADESQATLRVVDLTQDLEETQSLKISGQKLAWLGSSDLLVYGDQGDIHLMEVTRGTTSNLTASAAYDRDPEPSPDGRYILWTVYSEGEEPQEPELRVMNSDGSNPLTLAPLADLATWDPAGGRVISRANTAIPYGGEAYSQVLQSAVPGGSGWNYFTECDGEARYIWWPAQDELLYVSPQSTKGRDIVKGVWFQVRDPDALSKVASTDALSYEERYYHFYPSRTGKRLAYVGEKGLEYLDYEEKIIYRYTDITGIEPGTPLAWNEAAARIYYLGPGGIYGVPLGDV